MRAPTILLAVALASAVTACRDDGGGRPEVTVFAAASLTDVFADLGERFEEEHGADVTFSFGGSSSLREQILEGAPADVFASAGPGPMRDLEAAGAVAAPATFATNRLQLAVPAGNPAGVRGLGDLARSDLLVGLCAAEVPCGALARQVLDAAGVGAAPDTEEADVRALLTKLEQRELDAGLVYATDVTSAAGAVEGIDLDDGGALTEYPIAVVDGAAAPGLADDFVALVRSERGQQVLRTAGFGTP